MRLNKLFLIVLAFLVAAECNAAEQILEPHAMFYYTIPLGGSHGGKIKPAFGFRMDTALVEPGKPIDYPKLFRHQAVFDLKFDHDGIEELKISGVDYLKQYRALQANGDETGSTADNAGTTADNAEAAEAGTAPAQQGEAGTTEKKGGIMSKLPDYSNAIKKTQYLGLIVGAMVGIGFLMGI